MKKLTLTLAALATWAAATSAHAVILHNNGEVTNGLGLSVVASGSNTLGYNSDDQFALADDFAVGAGKRWTVQSLDFFAYQTNAISFTYSKVKWRIVSGNVNTGAVVASGDTVVTDGGLMGYRVSAANPAATNRAIYRIQADMADFNLLAGNYWVTWQLSGDAALGGPFVAPTSDGAAGNAMQRDTLDAAASFLAVLDGASAQPANLPFLVNGTVEDVVAPPPVPEPATYGLMLLGLAGVGAVARRRKA